MTARLPSFHYGLFRAGRGFRLLAAALLLLGAVVLPQPSRADAQGLNANWSVVVGATGDAPNHGLFGMYPNVLTVRVGDTVTFTRGGAAPHSATFLSGGPRPTSTDPAAATTTELTYDGSGYRNSGIMGFPGVSEPYQLQFTAPGSFSYICILHALQVGTIVVVPANSSQVLPSQAEVSILASQQIARDNTELQAAVREQAALYPQRYDRSYVVAVDVTNSACCTATQYFPAVLRVRTGDTVTWVNPSRFEGHTVTFLGGAPPAAARGVPTGGGPIFRGGQTSSGTFLPGQSFSLTFGQAGTFPYICAIHGENHTGVIMVDEGTAAAEPAQPVMGPSQQLAGILSGLRGFFGGASSR